LKITAIILARGGSKGLPNKNILNFCGKPLISWTIENCFNAGISSVWVSSDSDEILEISKKSGAQILKRPDSISNDNSTSEEAWLHAINYIESVKKTKIDFVFAPQVTSPLRETKDIINAIKIIDEQKLDSLFSSSIVEDLFFWEKDIDGTLESVNYDWKNRKRRQDITEKFIENGSFYFFKPNVLRSNNNRFGGKIGLVKMEFWKMFEIDSKEDFKMCSALMNEFLIQTRND
jgi:CMP-N,N'-diacetyllegionaminic acid synthase